MEYKPFLKWAGGKTQLLEEIYERMPKKFNDYYEPFIGGGALFWKIDLTNREAFINDISKELIDTYKVVKRRWKKLMFLLDEHETQHTLKGENYFYLIRNKDRQKDWFKTNITVRAARFIYLNKAGFNGLNRVNSQGFNNVPWNQKQSIKLYDVNVIESDSAFLRKKVTISNKGFRAAVKNAKSGDFIFFDPPYDLLNENTFNGYTKNKFGQKEQIKLAKLANDLKNKGCYVMICNHDTPLIRKLYKNFKIDKIQVKRMVNANATKRTGEEVIIWGY